MTTHLKRLLRHTPIVLAMAFLLGSSRPAHAGCMIAFADCAVRAAAETSYWRAVFATADCGRSRLRPSLMGAQRDRSGHTMFAIGPGLWHLS